MENNHSNEEVKPVEQLDFLAGSEKSEPSEEEGVATSSETPEEERVHCQYCEDTNPDCTFCRGKFVD